MNCPACQAEVAEGAKFCGECGAALARACPSCGADTGADAKFCINCGTALKPVPVPQAAPAATPYPLHRGDVATEAGAEVVSAEQPVTVPAPTPADSSEIAPAAAAANNDAPVPEPHPAPGDALDGERRQATVLFADIAGYTETAEKLGEEDTYAVMQPILRRIVEIVEAHGGTTQDLAGDSVMALFGAPHAVEDAPLRACRAAIDVQDQMETLSRETQERHGVLPRFRIGVNTGPVVIGKMGADQRTEVRALGDTVNLASRIQNLAEPGTVLLSESTHGVVAGFVESESLGERQVKGKSKPVPVHRLVALNEGVTRFDVSRSRGLTDLIGRRRELELMEDVWAEAQTGKTCVFNLIGEAGIG